MSKEDFISGTIFEFKLPIDLGYGYCKILDFRHIREFDGVLVKVFDHVIRAPISDLSELLHRDFLFGARRMPWLPGSRGRGAWKMKGVLVAEDDSVVPDFKYSIKSSPYVMDESKVESWDVVRNINNYIPCAYEKVKHLEDTVISPRPAIEIRTAMEICRIRKLEIGEYFDLTKAINDLVYRQMSRQPIYNTIPKKLRGKAYCT